MNKELVVLILQYNSADLTLQLLESIEKFEAKNNECYRYILMDNKSQDDRFEEIRKRFSWVELIKYDDNLGFAKAHNRVMDNVNEPWIFLLNNDCILLNDAITRTLNEIKRVGADFATCTVLNEDLSNQNNYSVLPTPLHRIFLNTTGMSRVINWWRTKLQTTSVGYINGACLMIRRKSIPGNMLFDDRYFMYTEDLDLMFRFSISGKRGYRLASGRIIHLGGKSAERIWNDDEIRKMKDLEHLSEIWMRFYPRWQVLLAMSVIRATKKIRQIFNPSNEK